MRAAIARMTANTAGKWRAREVRASRAAAILLATRAVMALLLCCLWPTPARRERSQPRKGMVKTATSPIPCLRYNRIPAVRSRFPRWLCAEPRFRMQMTTSIPGGLLAARSTRGRSRACRWRCRVSGRGRLRRNLTEASGHPCGKIAARCLAAGQSMRRTSASTQRV